MKQKTVYWLILSIIVVMLAGIVSSRPYWISDDNEFLKGFVNHELLSVLAVILSITLASIAQIHLALVRVEQRCNLLLSDDARKGIKKSAYVLIGVFIGAIFVVMGKPLGGVVHYQTWTASANAVAIAILALYILVLIDITRAVFAIIAFVKDDKEN